MRRSGRPAGPSGCTTRWRTGAEPDIEACDEAPSALPGSPVSAVPASPRGGSGESVATTYIRADPARAQAGALSAGSFLDRLASDRLDHPVTSHGPRAPDHQH